MAKLWVVTIHEPVTYGRLYRRLIDAAPERFEGVVLLPSRTGGRLNRQLAEAWYRLRFWGVRGFLQVATQAVRASHNGSGDVAGAARRHGLPVVPAQDSEQAAEVLSARGARAAIAAVTGRVSPASLAALPGGWVNVHLGPLPRYAGLDAPFWCLYHDEPNLAVTLHYMTERLDAGPLIAQQSIPNDGRPYLAMLEDLFDLAYRMLLDYVGTLRPGPQEAIPQDLTRRTYFGLPPVEAGRVFRRRGRRFA